MGRRLFPALLAILALACAPLPPGPQAEEPAASPLLQSERVYGTPFDPAGRFPTAASGFNAFIVQAAKSFGTAAYLWQGDGVTREIRYQGTLIAAPYGTAKCHCVGASFQVYMTAYEAWAKQYGATGLRGLGAAEVKQLKQIWYVATSALEGSQAALTKYKLGTAVTTLAQAEPGDPVQIWRNNGSGHSVIFDSWVKSGAQITGIRYFSCQNSGAGFVSEPVGSGSSAVDPKRIHVVHPLPPSDLPDAGVSKEMTPLPVKEAGARLDGSATVPDLAGDAAGDASQSEPAIASGSCGCVIGASASSYPGGPGGPALLLLLSLAAGLRQRRRTPSR